MNIKKRGLTTEIAFAVCVIGLLLGYIWATFKPSAPFGELAWGLSAFLAILVTKRVVQRHEKFNNHVGDI